MREGILHITSGVGPIEVRRFVAQLVPWLMTECTARGFEFTGCSTFGDDDAPRSVQLHLAGPTTALASLEGTYALVARSPNRGKQDRKRWYVGVTQMPAPITPCQTTVLLTDCDIDTARSGGPGGQHVNRTETAVRIRHRPSGITVRVSATRSQQENKARALDTIRRALAERAHYAKGQAAAHQRNLSYRIVRGQPVRSFHLDPKGRLVERA